MISFILAYGHYNATEDIIACTFALILIFGLLGAVLWMSR
jgi:hypothetical protein